LALLAVLRDRYAFDSMSEDNKQSSGIVNFKNLMIEKGIETI